MMAPLFEHESAREYIGALIEFMTVELGISIARCGSTTFRREDRQKGLEPDKCYYIKNASRVKGMKRWDAASYPPPDLAIEIDITSRSIPRQPIYAAPGMPELWRYDGTTLSVLLLDSKDNYVESKQSLAFPALPLDQFVTFIHRMHNEPENDVLREFVNWVKNFPTP